MVIPSLSRHALTAAVLLASGVAWAELPTEVYPSRISEGQATQLTIEMGEAPGGADDLTPLEKDFRVLGRSQQSSTVITNGKMTRSNKLILTLAPKRTGTLYIPSFTLEGDQTEEQILQVMETSQAERQALSRQVRIESELSDQTGYVQQPLVYTLRLELTAQLYDGVISAPEVEEGDALIEELGEQRQYTTQRGNQHVQVVEQQYLVTPQRSGTLRLSESEVNGKLAQGRPRNTVFGPQYSRFRQVSLRSEPVSVEVKPVPANFVGQPWLPAHQLELTDDWQMDSLEVGQPITRTLTLTVRGLGSNQLPELKMAVPDGVRQYPEEPVLDQEIDNGELVSTLRQKVTLIPTQSGALEFPAVELQWWNVDLHRTEQARIEATGLQISGNANAAPASPGLSATPPPAPRKQPPPVTKPAHPEPTVPATTPEPATTAAVVDNPLTAPWLLATLGAGIAVIAGALGWWLGRRGRSERPARDAKNQSVVTTRKPVRPDLSALKTACQNNDINASRNALIHWCQQQWPGSAASLNPLLAQADPVLKAELQQLNKALYAAADSATHWQGDALWQAFQAYESGQAETAAPQSSLQPLNPALS